MKRILAIALVILVPVIGWSVPPPHPPVGGGGSGLTGGTSGHVVTASGATTIQDSGTALSNLVTLSGDQSIAGTKTFTGVAGASSTLTGSDWSDLAPGILRSVLIYEGHSGTPSLLQGGAIWARTDAQSNGAVAPVGTLQGISSYMHIKNSGSAGNEYTPLAINLSAEDQGRFWGIDASVLGPVNTQAELLTGPTFFIGNYNPGAIADGSVGLTVITKPFAGGGDASSDRATRTSYPVDIGIAIVGQSGNEDDIVTRGFTTALQIGGDASGWSDGSGSRFGNGIDLSQYDAYGISIHDPIGGSPVAAIATSSNAGNVGFGLTVPSARLHVLSTTEQLRVGYDTSNYYKATVGSTGGVTFDAVGAGAGFTFSDPVTLSTALTPGNGGTGLASYAVGDLLYASGATTLSKLADVATGSVLVSGGVTTAPAWSTAPTFAGTNLTGTAASLTAGHVTTNANLTGDVTSSGNATTLANIPAISGVNLTSLNASNLGSGNVPDARNTVSNSTTTTMSALGTIGGLATVTGTGAFSFTGGAGNSTWIAGTGNSRIHIFKTTTSGGTATTALTLGADQSAAFAGNVTIAGTSLLSNGTDLTMGAGSGNSVIFTANTVPFFRSNGNLFRVLGTIPLTFNDNSSVNAGSDTTGVGRATDKVLDIHGGSLGSAGTWRATPSSPSQIVADTNNYNPASSGYYQRWSTDASRNITGLVFTAAQVAGQTHVIVNVGAQSIVIVNESASSTAANRFHNSTGADITIAPDGEVNCWYDATTARWRVTKRGF